VVEQRAEAMKVVCALAVTDGGKARLGGGCGTREVTHLWAPSTGLEGLRAPSEPFPVEFIFNCCLPPVVPFRALTLTVGIGGQSRRAPPTQRGWRSAGGPMQESRRGSGVQ
jgi:hypothetical protein